MATHALTFESLGLSNEDIVARVVDRLADTLMSAYVSDEDGEAVQTSSRFMAMLEKKVMERVDRAVEEIAGKHVLPNVATYVENLTLQETNKWGEAAGKRLTFVEYLVQRAEHYLTERVDYQGKTKNEAGGYSWNGTQTRIAHLVHQHLHYSIERAMKEAVSAANSAIASGIQETVKIKLAEIAASIQVGVKVK